MRKASDDKRSTGETPMLRYAVLGMIGLAASTAWAQQTPPAVAPPPASTQTSNAVVAMEEPLPGDRWTYEVRDEITGTVSATRTNIVTEVTPKEVSTRVDTLGNSTPGQIIFDRSWNMVVSGSWKYSPNDGGGIPSPLAVGKTWNFQSNDVNSSTGSSWKRSGKSKVVGQETVTTKAGTFEAYKIETSYSSHSAKDPTSKNEVTVVTWYAPAIDHWVKRTFISLTNKHLMINNTTELTAYGRKQ
jgi:hypothetical protein